jgi:protein-S-isoprenylcysteine O-methyltransferase Ste14
MSPPLIDIAAVQRWRKLFIAAGLFALLTWTALVKAQPWLEHPVEHLGLVAIMVCVLGRAWCSLYIGGRKKQEIVASGPYSLCRNPLYVFSFIGAFGVGAQTGSLSVGAVFAIACWLVFRVVTAREETFLASTFGAAYRAYLARTPRFLPNPRLWRDETELSVRPAFFLRTVRDGLVFLLALPVFEGLEHLQNLGWLDALVSLP